MNHFNENFYQKDLEELKRLDILKYKTVNEMLNTFHEKLLEKLTNMHIMVWYGMSLPLVTPTRNQGSAFSFELLKVLVVLS